MEPEEVSKRRTQGEAAHICATEEVLFSHLETHTQAERRRMHAKLRGIYETAKPIMHP